MKIKKTILGVSASVALASVALVSCGGETSYKVLLDSNKSGVEFAGDVEEVKATNAKKLIAKLEEIGEPTLEGHTFKGWFLDERCSEPLTADTKLKSIKDEEGIYSIYAGFDINEYTVTFDYGNKVATAGQGTKSVGVNWNNTIETPQPTAPAKTQEGFEYTFGGWYEDADLTEAFDAESTKIKKDTTLYAKWNIAKISTAAEFIEYVSKSSTMNAYIANDITFAEGEKISRMKADLEKVEGSLNSNGTDATISLNHKLYGNKKTLTGLTINGDVKLAALWSSLNGGIYDLTIKDAKVTCSQGSTANTALIAGQVNAKTAVIEDVVVDGLEMTVGASAANVAVLLGQVKGAVDVSLDGIVLKDVTIADASGNGKYTAGLIGLIDKSAGGTITATDIMIDGLAISNVGERAGMFFGGIGNGGTADIAINIDGAVVSGSTTGKASSVLGDNRSTVSTWNVKNVVVVEFTAASPSDTNVDAFMTASSSEQPKAFNAENIVYRKWGVVLGGTTKDGDSVVVDSKNGTAVDGNANFAKVGNIEYAYDEAATTGTYTLKIDDVNYTLDVAKDPTKVDESTKPAVFTSTDGNFFFTDAKGALAETFDANTMIRVGSFKFPYVQAAVVGKAGYAVKVTIAPNASVTEKAGRTVISSDLYKATVDETTGVITGYLFLTDEDIALFKSDTVGYTDVVTRKIKVQWYATADAVALPVEYTIVMQGLTGISTLARITDGAVALAAEGNEENTDLEATPDATKPTVLNLTSGIVAADAETGANYITVTVPKAAAYTGETTADTIKLSQNAELVSYAEDVATIKVKLTSSSMGFSISWNSAWDDVEYTVVVSGTAKINKVAGALQAVTVTCDDIAKMTISSANSGVTQLNDYLSLVNSSSKPWVYEASGKTVDGVTYAGRLKSQASAQIKIDLSEVTGTVTVKITAVSSSSSADREVTIASSDTTVANSTFVIEGAAAGTDTLTLAAGAVYTLSWNSGVNLYAISLE